MKKLLVMCLAVASLGALSFAVSLEGAANLYWQPRFLGGMSRAVSDTESLTVRRGSIGLNLDVSVLFPLSKTTDLGANVGFGIGVPLPTSIIPTTTTENTDNNTTENNSTEGDDSTGDNSSNNTTTTTSNTETVTPSGLDLTAFRAGLALRMHFDKPVFNKELSLFVAPGISWRRRNTNTESYNLNLWAFYLNISLRLWLSEERTFGIDAGVNYNLLLPFKSSTYSSGTELEIFVGVVYNLDFNRNASAAQNETNTDDYYSDSGEYIEADSGSGSNAGQSAATSDNTSAADDYTEAESGAESGADASAGETSDAAGSADAAASDTEQTAPATESSPSGAPDIY